MTQQQQLVAEIEAFLRGRNMAETTFGRLAVNDGKFVGRLRAGKGVGVDTVDRTRRFIAEQTRAAPIARAVAEGATIMGVRPTHAA